MIIEEKSDSMRSSPLFKISQVMRDDVRCMLRWLLNTREPKVGMEIGIQGREKGCSTC